jgi:hypothetical protein
MRQITFTEFHVEILLRCKTRAFARKHGREFTKKIECSICDAIFQAARTKVREHVKAGGSLKDLARARRSLSRRQHSLAEAARNPPAAQPVNQ